MRTKAEIRDWIVTWLTRELAVERPAVESASTFADLGIGSRQAVMLSADLEGLVEHDLPPDLLWQFPTLDALVEHLA
jgi:phthiocerol/phenolphthiocerol synthesis type-I polyketide synthase B